MVYNIDFPIKVSGFGRVTQKSGNWHNGRAVSENIVIYCTDGFFEMEILDNVYSVHKGEILLIPAHYFYKPLKSNGCKYYFIHFSAQSEDASACITDKRIIVTNHTGLEKTDYAYTCSADYTARIQLKLYTPNPGREVLQIFEEAAVLDCSQSFKEKLMLDNLMRKLLICISNTCDTPSAYPKKLIAIMDYIDQNYSEHLTLSCLSERFQLSKSYIARIFKEKAGQKPSEYINKVRISASKHLLIHSDMSISEISEKVGYSDVYYYSRMFKKSVFITPSEFRNGNKSNRQHIRFQ